LLQLIGREDKYKHPSHCGCNPFRKNCLRGENQQSEIPGSTSASALTCADLTRLEKKVGPKAKQAQITVYR
jgi:hypothetical protein